MPDGPDLKKVLLLLKDALEKEPSAPEGLKDTVRELLDRTEAAQLLCSDDPIQPFLSFLLIAFSAQYSPCN